MTVLTCEPALRKPEVENHAQLPVRLRSSVAPQTQPFQKREGKDREASCLGAGGKEARVSGIDRHPQLCNALAQHTRTRAQTHTYTHTEKNDTLLH